MTSRGFLCIHRKEKRFEDCGESAKEKELPGGWEANLGTDVSRSQVKEV